MKKLKRTTETVRQMGKTAKDMSLQQKHQQSKIQDLSLLILRQGRDIDRQEKILGYVFKLSIIQRIKFLFGGAKWLGNYIFKQIYYDIKNSRNDS